MSKKRITLYLDLDIEEDKSIWNFLDGRRKSETIRNVLYGYIENSGVPKRKETKKEKRQGLSVEELEIIGDFIK